MADCITFGSRPWLPHKTKNMKKIFTAALCLLSITGMKAQSYDDNFTRSLSDVMKDIEKRFDVKMKYDMDTTGLKVSFADFRIRPYSLEETMTNILSLFDFKAVYQDKNIWKVKRYEYPRRQPADGKKLIGYLSSLYNNKEEWTQRRDIIRKEVRERLGIDPLLAKCCNETPKTTKARRHDGYTSQNFCLKTFDNYTIRGTIYTPSAKGKHPLIICPIGHFYQGRYNKDLQKRYGTLARMGAICVSYDLWGWGESEDEVGSKAHRTPFAQQMQIVNGLKILDWMIERKDVDKTRVGVNGGSGGGSQTVLLSVLDDRFTAACPTVSMSAWFDGGCPCESGMPIQLAGGGTCNAELAATFAPKPMMVISDGGDWTSTTPEVEFPYLQKVYGFFGEKDKVENIHLPKERHDFGPNKRKGVYQFFEKVFSLDASKIDEDKVDIESESTLRYSGAPQKIN